MIFALFAALCLGGLFVATSTLKLLQIQTVFVATAGGIICVAILTLLLVVVLSVMFLIICKLQRLVVLSLLVFLLFCSLMFVVVLLM